MVGGVIYTDCEPFVTGTKMKLKYEVITVTCKLEDKSTTNKLIYQDVYIILKEYLKTEKHNNE